MPAALLPTLRCLLLAAAMPTLAGAATLQVQALDAWPAGDTALAARPVGRVEPAAASRGWRYQWPGTYFEARFAGTTVDVDLGHGAKHARVSVDGREVADRIGAAEPMLRIAGLAAGPHQVRVDIVSESRDAAQDFGGFAVPAGTAAAAAPSARARSIEFIGDSYTVGYGDASPTRTCSADEVWRTTDNSLAFGPIAARRFDADYRILAISGRGMVRNFANGGGDTLPAAYARRLPSEAGGTTDADDGAWSPQVIVIGLGTNDFSTPVGAGEPWRDAAALSAAFEARYVDFVTSLHRRHPQARFLLLATDVGEGAAEQAIRRVRTRLVDAGVVVGEVLALGPLEVGGCDWHPSRADHAQIARRVGEAIEGLQPGWRPGATRGD
jgi:lysophospholipase L1-like esterase